MINLTAIGNLGKDAQLIEPKDNKKPFYSFSIGVTENDNTTWIECSISKEYGDKIAQYLTKGKQIYIEGKPYSRSFQVENEARSSLACFVSNIELLGSSPKPEK